MENVLLIIALALSVSAILYAFVLYRTVMKAPVGSDKVAEISGYIKEGAKAFLRSEYKVIYTYSTLGKYLRKAIPHLYSEFDLILAKYLFFRSTVVYLI